MIKKMIIGLGGVGKNISKAIKQFNNQLEILTIDSSNADFIIQKDNSIGVFAHEQYEQDYSSIFKDIELGTDSIIFIVSGGSDISGATLSILSFFKNYKITILYIKPDIKYMSDIMKKQEHVVRNILQEYTRSGLFEKIILCDNKQISTFLGKLSLNDYFTKINEIIAFAICIEIQSQGLEPIWGELTEIFELNKIQTYGVFLNNREEFFYPLTTIKKIGEKNKIVEYNLQKQYIFFESDETLSSDVDLLDRINEKITQSKESPLESSSFAIYSTQQSEEEIVLIRAFTSLVQTT